MQRASVGINILSVEGEVFVWVRSFCGNKKESKTKLSWAEGELCGEFWVCGIQ